MKLICYPTGDTPPAMRPAPATRGWMDRTSASYAYRCLPLNIANAHGWEVLSPARFSAVWDGSPALEGIKVTSAAEPHLLPISHFGHGVLTFHIHALFRTEPGWDMMVGGPVNRPKDSIQPLAGVVETDWAPYTFTMNWMFTRAFVPIRFEEGEPFCTIYPVPRAAVRDTEPEIRSMESDPELAEAYKAWQRSRSDFLEDLRQDESDARQKRWQKSYYRGLMPDGRDAGAEHRTKLQPRDFVDRREE
jgi:hypothetical protein